VKIYIACALTHVPRNHFSEYAGFLHRLAGELLQNGHEAKYALMNSDPQLAAKRFEERARLCYLWDSRMVQEAEAVIGECSFPSIGLGVELQIATEREVPIILVFRDYHGNQAEPIRYHNPDDTEHDLQIGDGFVSLMALGLPTVFSVHRYSTDQDGISMISKSLSVLQK
jgi:hypothetical protein